MKLYYGWIVVAVGALMTCVAAGSVFSLAVLLQPIAETTGWSRTGVSTAMTLVFLTMGVGGFGWGALTDRFGPRVVVMAGTPALGGGPPPGKRAAGLVVYRLLLRRLVCAAARPYVPPHVPTV